MKNKIHIGENFDILREMDSETVDLICTDPPFNAGRNYNIIVKKPSTNDNWMWDKAAEDTRADIEIKAASCPTYKALSECLRGFDIVLRNSALAIRTYLAFMGPRLAEMHRILSESGSIYLHCEPSVSHYLKCVMDYIFGIENFRNEIVWCFQGPGNAKDRFPRNHDVILFYGKSKNTYFNADEVRVLNRQRVIKAGRSPNARGNRDSFESVIMDRMHSEQVKLISDYWTDIPSSINMLRLERLGYATQKPLSLYQRMIKASSKEGDIVLDPFCGGGTTLDAAQAHKRNWIGIDISVLALDPIKHRLKDRYGLEPSKDYEIEGYPSNMQDLRKLGQDKTRQDEIAHWTVTRLGLVPSKDADSILWTPSDKEKSDVRILADFKAGKPTLKQIHAFRKSVEGNKADIGIFITFDTITTQMREIAESMPKFEYKGLTYPRLQFVQFTDAYFENPDTIYNEVEYPGVWHFRPNKKIDRKLRDFHFDMDMKIDKI